MPTESYHPVTGCKRADRKELGNGPHREIARSWIGGRKRTSAGPGEATEARIAALTGAIAYHF